jgi:hypothetical protein
VLLREGVRPRLCCAGSAAAARVLLRPPPAGLAPGLLGWGAQEVVCPRGGGAGGEAALGGGAVDAERGQQRLNLALSEVLAALREHLARKDAAAVADALLRGE